MIFWSFDNLHIGPVSCRFIRNTATSTFHPYKLHGVAFIAAKLISQAQGARDRRDVIASGTWMACMEAVLGRMGLAGAEPILLVSA